MKHSKLLSVLVLAGLLILSSSFFIKEILLNKHAPEIFVGTSPCAASARSILKIPGSEKCDWITWKLTLFHEGETSTFTLEREYIFFIDNRTSESKGKISIEGKWKVAKGTGSYPGKMIYELHSDKYSISFLKVNANLLHLMESDKSLMKGDGGQSFTLSKTGVTGVSSRQSLKGSILLSSGIKESVINFAGRSPCKEIAKVINLESAVDCNKIKWDLRLFQDPVTFAPTKYELRRTGHRQSVIEGKWQIIKSTESDNPAIIYQLDPDKPRQSLYFLQGDKNVLFFLDKEGNLLVGNKEFSYTLNRIEKADLSSLHN